MIYLTTLSSRKEDIVTLLSVKKKDYRDIISRSRKYSIYQAVLIDLDIELVNERSAIHRQTTEKVGVIQTSYLTLKALVLIRARNPSCSILKIIRDISLNTKL